MSRTYATPLELELLPSRQQRYFVSLVFILAALSVLILPWPLVLRLTVLIVLGLVSYYLLRTFNPCSHIMWQSDNHWLLTSHNIRYAAVLMPESLVTPMLVILLFRDETGRRQSVVIWPDSVDASAFRRLRVRLKLEAEKLVTEV